MNNQAKNDFRFFFFVDLEVVDTVERQSASPSPLTDALPQREGALDAVILAESQVVAPPQLAPPGEGR